MSVRHQRSSLQVPFGASTKGKVDDWDTELLFFETVAKSPNNNPNNNSASTGVTAVMSDDEDFDASKLKQKMSVSESELDFSPDTPKTLKRPKSKRVPAAVTPSKSCGELSKKKLHKQHITAAAVAVEDSPFVVNLLESDLRSEHKSKVAVALRKKKTKPLEVATTGGGSDPEPVKKEKHPSREERLFKETSLKPKLQSSDSRRARSRSRGPASSLRRSKSKLVVSENADNKPEDTSNNNKDETPANVLESSNDDRGRTMQSRTKSRAAPARSRSRSTSRAPGLKRTKSKLVQRHNSEDPSNQKEESFFVADFDSAATNPSSTSTTRALGVKRTKSKLVQRHNSEDPTSQKEENLFADFDSVNPSSTSTRAPGVKRTKSKVVQRHNSEDPTNQKEENLFEDFDSVNPSSTSTRAPGVKRTKSKVVQRAKSEDPSSQKDESLFADFDSNNSEDSHEKRRPRSSSKVPLKRTNSMLALYLKNGTKPDDNNRSSNRTDGSATSTNSENDSNRFLSAKDKIQAKFLEQRNKERSARLELAKERIRQQQTAGKPEHERRQLAYDWYKRLDAPSREEMKHQIEGIAQCDITADDVDLLPWSSDGTKVWAKKMAALQSATSTPAPAP